MMISLWTVIDRNNVTISFLQQQDFPNAVASSTSAMTLLRELQRTKSSPDIDAFTVTCAPDFLDISCMLLFLISTPAERILITMIHSVFVYDQGIVIPPTATKYESISSILIFNSALGPCTPALCRTTPR